MKRGCCPLPQTRCICLPVKCCSLSSLGISSCCCRNTKRASSTSMPINQPLRGSWMASLSFYLRNCSFFIPFFFCCRCNLMKRCRSHDFVWVTLCLFGSVTFSTGSRLFKCSPLVDFEILRRTLPIYSKLQMLFLSSI